MEIQTLAAKSALIEEGKREREWARHIDWVVTHHRTKFEKLLKKAKKLPPKDRKIIHDRIERLKKLRDKTLQIEKESTTLSLKMIRIRALKRVGYCRGCSYEADDAHCEENECRIYRKHFGNNTITRVAR
ncbi:MAG: hypothetical protein ACFFDT_29330 [Candidatus Hodarchaeota archaeon]